MTDTDYINLVHKTYPDAWEFEGIWHIPNFWSKPECLGSSWKEAYLNLLY